MDEKIFQIQKKIEYWKNRDLTLQGKKLLINSYVLSTVSFLTEVYTTHVPDNFITQTKQLICEFLWGKKTWQVAQTNVGLKNKHGGIELQDLHHFIESKKLKWVIRIHFSNLRKWNALGKHYFQSCDKLYQIEYFLLQCSSFKGIDLHVPSFYKTCLDVWCKIQSNVKVVSKSDILSQNLFGNCNISKNQHAIFYSHWSRSGIKHIKYLWDHGRNKWKTGAEICNRLIVKRNWIAEYQKLKDCIPLEWKYKLCDEFVTITKDDYLLTIENIHVDHLNVHMNGVNVDYKKIRQKELYYLCLYPCKKPICIESWKAILQEPLCIEDVFNILKHPLYNKKSLDFHWKVLHRCIFTEHKLKLMGKNQMEYVSYVKKLSHI